MVNGRVPVVRWGRERQVKELNSLSVTVNQDHELRCRRCRGGKYVKKYFCKGNR